MGGTSRLSRCIRRRDSDVWVLDLQTHEAQPFLRTSFDETAAAFSPDGRWIAFQSNESTRSEVYVQAFPGPGARYLMSVGGGVAPFWSGDGRTLFYSAGSRLMAVRFEADTDAPGSGGAPGGQHVASAPTTILEYEGASWKGVSADGSRFLMEPSRGWAASDAKLQIALEWLRELRRLSPTPAAVPPK